MDITVAISTLSLTPLLFVLIEIETINVADRFTGCASK
jgi:hypothetical protein